MGGRGSRSGAKGAGVRAGSAEKRIQDFTNFDDLADYMLDQYNFALYDDLKTLDFEFVKQAANEVVEIKKEFPQAADMFRGLYIETRNNGEYAQYEARGLVALSPKFQDNRVVGEYSAQVRAGYAPSGTNYTNLISHELGHGLENALATKKYSSPWERDVVIEKHKEATRIVPNAAKSVKKTSEGKGAKTDDLVLNISQYASKSRSEALAEAVSDYRANGANAKPLSRAIWAELKKEWG